MKKIVLIGTALLLIFGMSVFAGGTRQQGEQQRQAVRLATGGSAGTYYAFGSAIAQVVGEQTGITIAVQSTGASRANILLIDDGEADIAMVQNDVMDYAWRGVDLFNGQQIRTFNTMAALYAEVCQVVANPASGIRTIADLRGKNVSVGDAGSGVEFNSRQILEAYGMTFDDIGKQNLSFAASADALRDGKIDAFFCVAGPPTPAITDLATNRDIIILDIDESAANRLISSYPFYTRFPIPIGTYRGQNTQVMTVAVKATLIVSTNLSEDTVYRLTKSLFDSKARLELAHAKGAELSLSYAVEGISVPFHPGAARYFREIGALR
jgi:TRAP transporter TAXI family solute receptor